MIEWAIADVLDAEMKSYSSPAQRAAYRAGLSTSAMICDTVARTIRMSNPGKHKGTSSSVGEFGAGIAESCGNEIMTAREFVRVNE